MIWLMSHWNTSIFMGPTKVSQHLNFIWVFSYVFGLWQILDVICTFFIHPEHYMNATLFQNSLQIYCSATFFLEWQTCSASILVQYVVQARGRKGLCDQLLHSIPIMGQISEHRNSLPQVSCMLSLRFPPWKRKF